MRFSRRVSLVCCAQAGCFSHVLLSLMRSVFETCAGGSGEQERTCRAE